MRLAERITCLGYGNILAALKEAGVDSFIKKLLI